MAGNTTESSSVRSFVIESSPFDKFRVNRCQLALALHFMPPKIGEILISCSTDLQCRQPKRGCLQGNKPETPQSVNFSCWPFPAFALAGELLLSTQTPSHNGSHGQATSLFLYRNEEHSAIALCQRREPLLAQYCFKVPCIPMTWRKEARYVNFACISP